MSDGTGIEWTDATWNPIRARNLKTCKIGWHCEHVTTGCEHCYAEGINKRLGTGLAFKPGHRDDVEIYLDEKILTLPLRWKRPRKIFVGSMTDLFASFVTDEMLDRIFAVMALCPQHTFQVLTKRAERMRDYLTRKDAAGRWVSRCCQIGIYKSRHDFAPPEIAAEWTYSGLPNVWLGVSCERQAEADERIPLLLQTPSAVRFISAEPLLGPIKLWHFDDDAQALRGCGVIRSGGVTPSTPHGPPEGYDDSYPGLDWVIVGGESGRDARPMYPDWARKIRDDCDDASVPFFFKQWGEWVTDDGYPGEKHRIGRKAAGRLLDGREHNDFPQQQNPAMTDDPHSPRSPLVTQA